MEHLASMHMKLRLLIADLASETSKPAPDMPALSAIRLKLSQTSRARATRLEMMFDGARASAAGVSPELARVVEDARQARLLSAGHIGKWTLKTIEADWEGYCRASANMRTFMINQINAEAKALKLP